MSDFDLPRWTAPTHGDILSSSTSSQPSYLYAGAGSAGGGSNPGGAGAPPPPSLLAAGGRQPSSAQVHALQSPSRATRISQLLDNDLGSGGPYTPPAGAYQQQQQTQQQQQQQANLARSASLGGPALTARGRRHRVQDDLEGAFHEDADMSGPGSQTPGGGSGYSSGAYYTPGHHHSHSAAAPVPPASADAYQDSYFGTTGLGGTPRRANTHRESAARAPLSPPGAGAPLADPYSPQMAPPSAGSAQYSPALGGYAYSSERQPRTNPSTPYGHSRSHSRVNADGGAGALGSPLSFQQASGGAYAGYGGMDLSTSPQPPPGHAHLGAGVGLTHSVSTPSSPIGGMQHYGFVPQPGYDAHGGMHAMAIDMPPPPPRRAAPADVFRHIRDARDLQPRLNPSPANRRIDPATQDMLSVSLRRLGPGRRTDELCVTATEAADDASCGNVSDVQSRVPI
jgi:hypothetical protein